MLKVLQCGYPRKARTREIVAVTQVKVTKLLQCGNARKSCIRDVANFAEVNKGAEDVAAWQPAEGV